VILEGLTEKEAKSFLDNPGAGWTVRAEQMEAEPIPEGSPEEPAPKPAWEPQEGDIVQFKGGMQYSQANGTVGSERPAGLAKITKTAPGKMHPWHLVKTGTVGPYGWVDRDTFEKE